MGSVFAESGPVFFNVLSSPDGKRQAGKPAPQIHEPFGRFVSDHYCAA